MLDGNKLVTPLAATYTDGNVPLKAGCMESANNTNLFHKQ
jgi:hypothetical protein